MDITGISEMERKAEQKLAHNHINEERGLLIDAAVVRIMKTRKRLVQRELIGEVLSQLLKFKPNVQQIKVRQ